MKRVLVPIDGSPQAQAALEFAAGEWPDAAFVLLNVIDPVEAGYSASALPTGSEEWYQDAKRDADGLFAEALAAVPLDREHVTTRIEAGRPARTIVDVADEGDIDHVVIGSHGRAGVSRIVLGSVAEAVVRKAPVPVTVVR